MNLLQQFNMAMAIWVSPFRYDSGNHWNGNH